MNHPVTLLTLELPICNYAGKEGILMRTIRQKD